MVDMCTVVVRWGVDTPLQALALRDELVGREFDDPGPCWPNEPDVVGGRDRTAGGTWCASRLDTGASALVLNRPEHRLAAAGAPSRGILPLLALQHGSEWPSAVVFEGMASFAVVLASPTELISWLFDGDSLSSRRHGAGTHIFTSGGAEDGKAERYLTTFGGASFPAGWRAVLDDLSPTDDLSSLVVRREREGRVYGTVFGQLIEQRPGWLRLEYSRTPWGTTPWEVLELP